MLIHFNTLFTYPQCAQTCANKVLNALELQISYLNDLLLGFGCLFTENYDEKSMLMVTDASGLPLGFDTLDEQWSSCNCFKELAQGERSGATKTFYKIVDLLQRCMDAPMGGGMPRKFRRLKVNDKILHRWDRSTSSRLVPDILTCSEVQSHFDMEANNSLMNSLSFW